MGNKDFPSFRFFPFKKYPIGNWSSLTWLHLKDIIVCTVPESRDIFSIEELVDPSSHHKGLFIGEWYVEIAPVARNGSAQAGFHLCDSGSWCSWGYLLNSSGEGTPACCSSFEIYIVHMNHLPEIWQWDKNWMLHRSKSQFEKPIETRSCLFDQLIG